MSDPKEDPMTHPLLTKVLHDALTAQGNDGHFGPYPGEWPCEDTAARIPPDIADRLERALDECQWYDEGDGPRCGEAKDHPRHHDPRGHAFVPLVLTDDR